jgi:hypothetical protein
MAYNYTLEDKEEAVRLCKENGEDPYDWLDYADLRNDKQRWEYFLPKKKPIQYTANSGSCMMPEGR